MKCRVGCLGLPNVGKSSLFNALAQQSIATAANYPFCTIEPHHAPIAVPDAVLPSLGTLAGSTTTRPATLDWIDVAGLAPNAHQGQGLGNQFLGTLRECHVLCHVVRVFEDCSTTSSTISDHDVVHHVTGRVDPVQDVELVNLELVMADVEHVQRRLARIAAKASPESSTTTTSERSVLERIHTTLQRGQPARILDLTSEERASIQGMGLLTLKPVVYAFNVDEVDFTLGRAQAEARIRDEILPALSSSSSTAAVHTKYEKGSKTDAYALVSAKLEAELYETYPNPQDRLESFVNELGMPLSSLDDMNQYLSYSVLPSKVMDLLQLAVVYTGPGVPPERSRTTKTHLFAPSKEEWTAHDLAGRLHGDIQRGFIRAQVMNANELVTYPSWAAAKEAGRIRTEGKNYRLAPNDVVLIQWR